MNVRHLTVDKENVSSTLGTANGRAKSLQGSKDTIGKTSKLDWNTRAALLQEQLRAARNAIKVPSLDPKDRKDNAGVESNSSKPDPSKPNSTSSSLAPRPLEDNEPHPIPHASSDNPQSSKTINSGAQEGEITRPSGKITYTSTAGSRTVGKNPDAQRILQMMQSLRQTINPTKTNVNTPAASSGTSVASHPSISSETQANSSETQEISSGIQPPQSGHSESNHDPGLLTLVPCQSTAPVVGAASEAAAVVVIQPSLVLDQPSLVVNQPPLVVDQPSLVVNQPPSVVDQPSLVASQPPLVVDQPSLLVNQSPLVVDQPSLVVDQHSLVVNQPSLVVNQPSLVVNQPSLVANQPSEAAAVKSTQDKEGVMRIETFETVIGSVIESELESHLIESDVESEVESEVGDSLSSPVAPKGESTARADPWGTDRDEWTLTEDTVLLSTPSGSEPPDLNQAQPTLDFLDFLPIDTPDAKRVSREAGAASVPLSLDMNASPMSESADDAVCLDSPPDLRGGADDSNTGTVDLAPSSIQFEGDTGLQKVSVEEGPSGHGQQREQQREQHSVLGDQAADVAQDSKAPEQLVVGAEEERRSEQQSEQAANVVQDRKAPEQMHATASDSCSEQQSEQAAAISQDSKAPEQVVVGAEEESPSEQQSEQAADIAQANTVPEQMVVGASDNRSEQLAKQADDVAQANSLPEQLVVSAEKAAEVAQDNTVPEQMVAGAEEETRSEQQSEQAAEVMQDSKVPEQMMVGAEEECRSEQQSEQAANVAEDDTVPEQMPLIANDSRSEQLAEQADDASQGNIKSAQVMVSAKESSSEQQRDRGAEVAQDNTEPEEMLVTANDSRSEQLAGQAAEVAQDNAQLEKVPATANESRSENLAEQAAEVAQDNAVQENAPATARESYSTSHFEPGGITAEGSSVLEQVLASAYLSVEKPTIGQTAKYFQTEGIVVYTTSMRTIRKTYDDCEKVRSMFEILGVDYEDRDVSMSAEWLAELEGRMGHRSTLPRVFLNGKYLGGAPEIEELVEDYKLSDMLKEAGYELGTGSGTGGAGRQKVEWVICFCCNGSKKIEDEDGFVISCGECNDNGLMPWTQEDEEKYASMAAGEVGSPTSSVGSPTLESEFL